MPRLSQPKLSVNLNKIALLRNQRDFPYPSPVILGRIALQAGAAGLTVHPRPDQRHIRFDDVYVISSLFQDEDWQKKGREYNIEGYPSDEFLTLIERAKPDQVTLVPDAPNAHTSDSGWQLEQRQVRLQAAITRLKEMGVRISLFMDADPDRALTKARMQAAKDLKADRVELYTGPYAENVACHIEYQDCLDDYEFAASTAHDLGLGVNAGHDLTLDNLPAFLDNVPHIGEVSIGHALSADCMMWGMAETVARYCKTIKG